MARRKKSDNERIFSCPECGEPYTAYPPDDSHDTVTLDEQEAKTNALGKIITIMHDCNSCKKTITLYWYHQKVGVGAF